LYYWQNAKSSQSDALLHFHESAMKSIQMGMLITMNYFQRNMCNLF